MKNCNDTKKGRGRLPLPHLDNERGMLLVIVMVIMLVVASLAASSLINSFLEKSLSQNQNYASIALQAADGGLADGLTWIRENRDAIPEEAPWDDPLNSGNDWVQTVTGSLASGGQYQVTMRFKRESFDYDGDGSCAGPGEWSGYDDGDAEDPENGVPCPGELVLYNSCGSSNDQCWGFSGSLFTVADDGFPVIEILSIGYYSPNVSDPQLGKYASVREIAMDVARNKLDIQVAGAITARGNITQSGSGYADGHNFNIAGDSLSDSCDDLPAVTVDQGLTPPPCAADNDFDNPPTGNPKGLYGGDSGQPSECNGVWDPADFNGQDLQSTPWGLMGIEEATFNTLFTVADSTATVGSLAYEGFNAFTGTQANPALIYHQEDMHITGGSGFGILVVHNVNFDPYVYEQSDPASSLYKVPNPDGAIGDKYNTKADSSHADYEVSYSPATLFMNGIADFTGVIIADNIIRVAGTAETIGAMISLGGINVDGDVTGNWTAKYSCDAIEAALAGFGYGTKLNWHRIR